MGFRLFNLLLWLMVFFVVMPVAAAPDDFSEAKRLAQRIYSDENQTFYCGCPLRWQGGKGIPDLKNCGYKVRKNGPRAQRIEWEHIVPAHHFGKNLRCWQQGGRDNCQQKDPLFGRMEADLFNLKPAIGEVNGDRANFAFAELPAQKPQYGACDFKVDFAQKLAEPRPEVRGDIARIYFYMADKYALVLPKSQQQLLLKWHQEDPVDAREQLLGQRIAQQMGHPNYFVTGVRQWEIGYQPTGYGLSGVRQHNQVKTTKFEAAKSSLQTSEQSSPEKQISDVLGNNNSKIYHLAHCPGFSQVSVKNQRWFQSAKEAEQAGFRKAKNCN